jgi:hypothetical protein
MSDKNSRDAAKLGKFYTFEVTEKKFFTAQAKARTLYVKHLRNAFIFGFLIETMIIKTRLCIEYIYIYNTQTVTSSRARRRND